MERFGRDLRGHDRCADTGAGAFASVQAEALEVAGGSNDATQDGGQSLVFSALRDVLEQVSVARTRDCVFHHVHTFQCLWI